SSFDALRALASPSALAGGASLRAFDGSASAAPAPGAVPVFAEYADFLTRLGFGDGETRAREALRDLSVARDRRRVLQQSLKREALAAGARDLAARVMAALDRGGFAPEQVEHALRLAAHLAAFSPLEAPQALPAGLGPESELATRQWLAAQTSERMERQVRSLTAQALAAAAPRSAALEPAALAREAAPWKALLEQAVLPLYADPDMGQARYAGRALAASFVRLARRGRPEVESRLEALLAERGMRLADLVGDVVQARDAAGRARSVRVRNGDFLGIRGRARKSAEITAAVRPHDSLMAKARKMGLLGHPVSVWIKPDSETAAQVPGQPVRNLLRRAWHAFRVWAGNQPLMLRGFSHVAMARVQEADGVSMSWAVESEVDSHEGGLRKIGLADQFLNLGSYVRFGVSRLDPEAVWDDFHRQAAVGSLEAGWPRLLSDETRRRLLAIPREEAPRLLAELHSRAFEVLETMMLEWGVGYAYGFVDAAWRAYCGSAIVLAYALGAGYAIRALPDQWHWMVRLLHRLGYANAKELDMEHPPVWPASFHLDPKIGYHETVEFARLSGVRERLAEGLSVPEPALTPTAAELEAALAASGASFAPDPVALRRVLERNLVARERKRRGKVGWRQGINAASGYFEHLERLYSRSG
ncbi:MAG TPA: hypothetical protein VNI01_14860, partial [Elusimicrobiota bacterium]|nr:hypothetical protein [Elusimicrobiota bacterium]